MSSRFERQRPAGDRRVSTLSPPPDDEPLAGERPWQTVVRRLRRLVEGQHAAPSVENEPRPRPELRLLPGGRTDATEGERPTPTIIRGRWQ